MITELFIANASIFLLHLYITYYYFKNPKLPIVSLLLLLASFFLASSIVLELNISEYTTPPALIAGTNVIIISNSLVVFNLLLFIVNLAFFIKYYLDLSKQKWREIREKNYRKAIKITP